VSRKGGCVFCAFNGGFGGQFGLRERGALDQNFNLTRVCKKRVLSTGQPNKGSKRSDCNLCVQKEHRAFFGERRADLERKSSLFCPFWAHDGRFRAAHLTTLDIINKKQQQQKKKSSRGGAGGFCTFAN
jgi:hypothetical protein